MAITITIEKLSEPWKASRPWLVTMKDSKAKFPIQWHFKTKRAAEGKKSAIEESAYYKTENCLL